MKEQKQESPKLPYEKPVVRVIRLAADEVLATGCKLVQGSYSSPNAPTCQSGRCAGIGS